jgi:hypothetical protein
VSWSYWLLLTALQVASLTADNEVLTASVAALQAQVVASDAAQGAAAAKFKAQVCWQAGGRAAG